MQLKKHEKLTRLVPSPPPTDRLTAKRSFGRAPSLFFDTSMKAGSFWMVDE
jgi:hypothetical protein